MTVSAGSRLGPYEVLAPIGKGGMGEVYRARDTRLDRDVAIKISAEQFSERFDREARAVAALNHPNICTLHDVGPNYLVMEYIEGPTLAERIKEGPIPLEEALRIARHVADALDAAHEKNIIHRDLKPGNIKIKPDGTVKVLDFGLAKMGGTPTAQKTEDSPTLTLAATQAGMILGTAAYMSPEQARGKEVDKRADIWAFGVVLYEMLTARRLFQGEDVGHTLATVIMKEPEWVDIPTQVQRLLKKCLSKDPAKRLRDIGDVWELLDEHGTGLELASIPRTDVRQRLAWIVAFVSILVAAVFGFIAYRATRPSPLKPLVRLDVDLGSDVSLNTPLGTDAIISPDGARLAYTSRGRLFVRRLDQPKAVELTREGEAVYGPFFSPDGEWIGYFGGGDLRKISVEGGTSVAICSTANARGGSWSEDGSIIVALGNAGPLFRIPATGGTPVPLTGLSGAETTHRWPQVLPGGDVVLFTANSAAARGYDGATIDVFSLKTHKRHTVVRGGTFGRYVPTAPHLGHLVYVNRGTLFAVPFDLDKQEVHGTPLPALDEVVYSAANGDGQISFPSGRTGPVVYRTGGGTGGDQTTVQWVDSSGNTQPLLTAQDTYATPRLSPDGSRLAFSTSDVWVYDWQRDTKTRVTFDGGEVPVWSPDGQHIVFRREGEGLFWTRADGAGKPQMLVSSKTIIAPWSFSQDGKRLAFQQQAGMGWDLWTVPLESSADGLRGGKPELFLQTPYNELDPVFSPDGRWLAYASNESGGYQIYVRSFPDRGGKWQISSSGGRSPVWARNGRDLFFNSPTGVMTATYTIKGDSFAADKPRVWFNKPLAAFGGLASFDLTPDGKRIVVLMRGDAEGTPQAQSHVIFLENFFDELRRKVPVK